MLMKTDLSKKRLTACCLMTNGLIVIKRQRFFILEPNYKFIIHLGKGKIQNIFFHKISDVSPFTKGIVKFL